MFYYILSSLVLIITILLTYIVDLSSSLVQLKKGGNNSEIIGEINNEYSKWLKSQEIKQLINNMQNPREVHNIVERWLITNANISGDIFVSNDETDKKLLSEFNEKNISNGDVFLDKMKLLQVIHIDSPSDIIVQLEPKCQLRYKNFVFDITFERLGILRKNGSDEQILKAALRYESLLPQGQQWAIPLEKYKRYVDDGATIEGFASPFNSQIIRLGDYKFCSLFIDTDAPFGSIGNFFTQNFANKYVIVNPPFVENILEKAADKCLSELSNNKCKFIFYGPSWTDSNFYNILSNSKYLLEKQNLQSRTYQYEDLFNNKTVNANFNSTVWILSS